jgi:hypothetical protein
MCVASVVKNGTQLANNRIRGLVELSAAYEDRLGGSIMSSIARGTTGIGSVSLRGVVWELSRRYPSCLYIEIIRTIK